MKALEKDRERRYGTVNGLLDDLQRYLRGEAVQAAPPSASYRLRKFVQKNRGTVLAFCSVAIALLIGVIRFAWQARRSLTAPAPGSTPTPQEQYLLEVLNRARSNPAAEVTRDAMLSPGFAGTPDLNEAVCARHLAGYRTQKAWTFAGRTTPCHRAGESLPGDTGGKGPHT